jgi:RNA polymerase sigma-70 factor (ECF subfamily)
MTIIIMGYRGVNMIAFLMVIEDESIRSKLKEVYELHKKKLIYHANNILNDKYEAEDAVQEALIKISEYIEEDFDPKCNKSVGLIVTIVRSISINIYNKRKHRKTVDIYDYENSVYDDEAYNPEILVIRMDERKRIAKKLKSVKQEHADLLSLKYYFGYTDKEIAEMLSISDGNVRIKLMRARRALYEIVGGEFDEKAQ